MPFKVVQSLDLIKNVIPVFELLGHGLMVF